MADAKQHPLVAELEKIAAGDVFAVDDVRQIVLQEVADIGPFLQIGGLHQAGFRPPEMA